VKTPNRGYPNERKAKYHQTGRDQEEVLAAFRQARDEIEAYIHSFLASLDISHEK